MSKTIAEINEKIKSGQAVVMTAEELIETVKGKGVGKATQMVDVVTTGTFGPMCSSGAYINTGQPKPKIKYGGGRVVLNEIPAYPGFAAADLYIGATVIPDDDPRNKPHPGPFPYGGAHVIEDLIAGKDVRLKAESYGTDCYPRKNLETWINIEDLNEAVLFNPRNAYQNYAVAINRSTKTIYTYMGTLRANIGNATYCSAGQLSPLLKDPLYRITGIGTRIFLGGGIGYVAWQGTQHNPVVERYDNGIPKTPAGTLAVIGDMKEMSDKFVKGASFRGYGVTLTVGIGIPIPILDEETCRYAALTDEEIFAPVVDYGLNYPQGISEDLGQVSYAQLKSGSFSFEGKTIKTAPLSSYSKAVEIANILKGWIEDGEFLLSEPVAPLPGPGSKYQQRTMKERP